MLFTLKTYNRHSNKIRNHVFFFKPIFFFKILNRYMKLSFFIIYDNPIKTVAPQATCTTSNTTMFSMMNFQQYINPPITKLGMILIKKSRNCSKKL